MINLGLIGYGYWGPRIARNFQNVPGCALTAVCDRSADQLRRAKQAHPGVEVTSDPCEILASPNIDAVAVITPVWTHFELAKAALENGKHVFVEKPFTSTSQPGGGTDRAGRPEEPPDHGGPHVPVHRRGPEDPPAHRRGRRWARSTTSTRRASTSACSSTT